MSYDSDDIPKVMRLVMVFIDRVGFPVLAFILMFVVSYYGMNKMSASMERTNTTLTELVTFTRASYAATLDKDNMIITNQSSICEDLKKLLVK